MQHLPQYEYDILIQDVGTGDSIIKQGIITTPLVEKYIENISIEVDTS
ncbi:MAG: hypothetical protein OCC49_08380 [Fibrobacterales bacterium]